jgi:hypothetical protein
MDAFVLLGSFCVLMMLGMPVAYALGLSALVGALWIDLPLDAVMIQLASGVNKFSLLAIPFFVLAGAIMAEGGMARRLVAFAAVLVGFMRGGLSLVNIMASTFFGAISGSSGGRHRLDRQRADPGDGTEGLPARLCRSRHGERLGAGHPDPAQPQRGDLLAGRRRHGQHRGAVHGRRAARPADGDHARGAVHAHRPAPRLPARRGGAAAPGTEDLRRCAVGPDDAGDHPGRHPLGRLHRQRKRQHRGAVGLLRHDVRLPRLSLARPAPAGAPHGEDGDGGDDPDRLRRLLRLPDDADADPAAGHDLLHRVVGQPLRDPGAAQRDAAGAGLPDGHERR